MNSSLSEYNTMRLETQPRRVPRPHPSLKKWAHKGTRAPSPDKLAPQTYTNTSGTMGSRKNHLTLSRPSVADYAEPLDQRESATYSESLYDYVSVASTLSAEHRRPASATSAPKLVAPYSVALPILSDYKEPCDNKVPIYSELGMMQRPLPLTPLSEQVNHDLGDICGTRL